MKKFLLLFLILNFQFSIFNSLSAQNPLAKMWDFRFGGYGMDDLTSFQETKDGGYILGGVSFSGANGNKSQSTWGQDDYWIVKLDSVGNKQWDKDFGGTGEEYLSSVWQTNDGGYILGGKSRSGISGNKTQACWGDWDYWIVKIDSNGNVQWDKTFGGFGVDNITSLQETKDKGYILNGYSNSGIGGDKTQANWGIWDYWIVKTDSLGNKQWDKDFGGTDADVSNSIIQTSDGGYILGGISSSNISGDKTQNTWGSSDFWIVKIDSAGSVEWDKDFGGTSADDLNSIQQTIDGGFILGGVSMSGIGGNKTQPTWGVWDYWIVKTDSLGINQWDNDFGGSDMEDFVGNIIQTLDRGYLICGLSESQISGDKSENNLGQGQAWIVKTDSNGIFKWDKTIFTIPEIKVFPYALQTKGGCYTVAAGSRAGIGGYKTQANWDITNSSYDFWIVKFCDSTIVQPLFTSTPNLCPGSCTDFLNLSTYATSYQWSFPGATPDTSTATNPTNICYQNSGSYDVQLIATNANGSDTLLLSNYITVFPTPLPQAIIQNGDTLFANAGAATYQWYFNGNIITGATDYFYIAPASGDYNLIATDSNGCEAEAVINNVMAGFSPLSFGEGSGVRLFPNPVMNELTVRSSESGVIALEVSIYNILGLAVNLPTANCQLPTCYLDVSALSKGIYYLEVIAGEKIFRTKFVKQ
jgi:hypothetical protein